jgi:hypothetical protein
MAGQDERLELIASVKTIGPVSRIQRITGRRARYIAIIVV